MLSNVLQHTQSVQELSAYRGIRMVAIETDLLDGIRPLFSFPEKQFPHPFVRSTEEVLESLWPFRIKLPHAKRPTLAWQDSADQHYLNHVDKIDVPLEEDSDAAL